MTREEQIAYCRVCKFKSFDPKKGIICKLTGEIADFEFDCENFSGDRNKIIHHSRSKRNEGELDAKIKMFFKNNTIVTPLIALICIFVFIIMSVSGVNIIHPDNESLFNWGANFKPVTLEGEYWRIFTNIFIHIGIIHLLFNMYALLIVGFILEKIIGKLKFIISYLTSGAVASIASLWYNDFVLSAGASGAIFGMYGILIILLLSKTIKVKNRSNLLISLLLFTGYNLIYGMKDGIDNAAHIGGLITGFVIGATMIPGFLKPDLKVRNIIFFLVSILFILSFSVFITLKIPNPYGKYGKLMDEFTKYESKAMINYRSYEIYSLSSNNYKILAENKNDILYDIDYKSMPYWKKCESIINEIKNIEDLPENLQKNTELTETYCNYRIDALTFMYKSIKFETTKYVLHIISYNNAIEKIINAINGESVPENSFKILSDDDLIKFLPKDYLYVLNGKPLSNKNKIVLNNIKSVDFYRGQRFIALYGNKAENGVFLISTINKY